MEISNTRFLKTEVKNQEQVNKVLRERSESLAILIEEYHKEKNKKETEIETIQSNIDHLVGIKTRLESLNRDVEVTDFRGLSLEKSHQATPWKSHSLNQLRSILFLKALRLHKAVIYENKEAFLKNLISITKLMSGKGGGVSYFRASERHLWATLFMVVPVLSTTFASLSSPSLFRNMPLCSIGWVFIDEAGQAAPHQAVGAIFRAKRVVVLGDPMQLPPIVTIPKELTNLILDKHQVPSSLFSVNQYSVQTIADRNSTIGTLIKHGDEKIWDGVASKSSQKMPRANVYSIKRNSLQ